MNRSNGQPIWSRLGWTTPCVKNIIKEPAMCKKWERVDIGVGNASSHDAWTVQWAQAWRVLYTCMCLLAPWSAPSVRAREGGAGTDHPQPEGSTNPAKRVGHCHRTSACLHVCVLSMGECCDVSLSGKDVELKHGKQYIYFGIDGFVRSQCWRP